MRRLAAPWLLAMGLWAAACGETTESPAVAESPAAAAPSALLLTLDTTRADHLTPYGAGEEATPALGRLARDGVVFERAWAVSPLTLPTHATMLTGLYPPQHGVRNNGSHRLGGGVATLAEAARDGGLRTAAFVSAAVLDRRYGLDRGFELYDDALDGGAAVEASTRSFVERPAAATVDAALAWLETLAPEEGFFLWVHLFDPHAEYAPPAPYRDRHAEHPYAGEIAYMDAEIGRLLAHPRLARDRAAVAAVADHGESLGAHGERTHGLLVYEPVLHVPFILRWPEGPRGLRVERPTSQIDLAPTLAELLGLAWEGRKAGRPGISLVSGLEREERAPRELYAESLLPYYAYGWSPLEALRRGRWKYVEAPVPELYDLEADPREQRNLAPERADLRGELAGRLERLTGALAPTEPDAGEIPEGAEAATLRSLGYVTATTRRPPDERPRPDPKERIELHHQVQQAETLLAEGRADVAERLLREILARDPTNPKALFDLAEALRAQGSTRAAAAALERAREASPGNPLVLFSLAELESRAGNLERAEEIWLELTREESAAAQAFGNLAALALERRQWEVARRHAERAVELDAGAAAAWNVLGFALDELGNGKEAERAYRRAVEADPTYWPASLNLGQLLRRQERFEDAEAALRRVLAANGEHPGAHCELALLYAGPLADAARARTHLSACLELVPAHPHADVLRQILRQLEAR